MFVGETQVPINAEIGKVGFSTNLAGNATNRELVRCRDVFCPDTSAIS